MTNSLHSTISFEIYILQKQSFNIPFQIPWQKMSLAKSDEKFNPTSFSKDEFFTD